MHEQTMEFSVQHDKEAELKKTLTIIYDALKEKGSFRNGKEDSYERNPGGVSFVFNNPFFSPF